MKVIVLAGGSGSRLWPFSRLSLPKQFLKVGAEHSLLQKTLERLMSTFKPDDLLVITSSAYGDLVREHVERIDPRLTERVILEPEARNTAAAILLGIKYWEDCGIDPQEPLLVLPSDHQIRYPEKFLAKVLEAGHLAKQGDVILFGVPPTYPETAYGYMKVSDRNNSAVVDVEKFVEKPSKERASEFFSSKLYMWNAGMLAFTSSTFWREANLYSPELAVYNSFSWEDINRKFSQIPSISIDYAFIEKLKRLKAVILDCEWSDMGSWDTVFETLEKDTNQNVKIGNVIDIDTKNSLIVGGKRVIATIGIEDLLVIETEDALFLGKKGESQRMRSVIQELINQGQHGLL